ncbi:MAG: winged helix DNA-binding domain-containing protein [Paludibacter sp.]|nr:winged helix DNA-binding domain-containing protein [Paludibacter sp.]
MTLSEISNLRIKNQQIEGLMHRSPKEIVSWFGAMQAQDFTMAKWAIGLRVLNSTEKTIEEAYNNGDILRTHLMRPTWHFVAADDINWMLELTAHRIKQQMNSNNKRLEMTDLIYSKSNKIIEKQLVECKNLTREELTEALKIEKINTNENRLSHILMRAELDRIICSGPLKGKKLTYSLLADRVNSIKTLNKDEALAELAKRYFTSHSPATLRDFIWWSGLSVANARHALELVKSNFISETINSETYWVTNSISMNKYSNPSIHLLPAFDEFLIGYTNREAALKLVDNRKIISENGIFRPTIVAQGQVIGLWKKLAKKNKVMIELNLFQAYEDNIKIESEIIRYETYLNNKVELTIK